MYAQQIQIYSSYDLPVVFSLLYYYFAAVFVLYFAFFVFF